MYWTLLLLCWILTAFTFTLSVIKHYSKQIVFKWFRYTTFSICINLWQIFASAFPFFSFNCYKVSTHIYTHIQCFSILFISLNKQIIFCLTEFLTEITDSLRCFINKYTFFMMKALCCTRVVYCSCCYICWWKLIEFLLLLFLNWAISRTTGKIVVTFRCWKWTWLLKL